MAMLSPLVHRPVRTGAILFMLAAAQFLVSVLVVSMRDPGYRWMQSALLDLGGSGSPWSMVFNASVLALGVLGFFGLLLIWSAFDERPTRGIGLLALLAGSAAVAVVGATPFLSRFVPSGASTIATYVAVAAAILGWVVLSFAMRWSERWRLSGPYTLATAVVMLAGVVLLGTGFRFGLGVGTLDWLVAAPALAWPLVEGAHIARLHRYAPGLQVKVASA